MNNKDIYVTCPHCDKPIMVYMKDINCAIFRHGVLKETRKQIDPHSSKNICVVLAMESKIYGCGKPFKLVRKDSISYSAEKCEYI